MNTKFVNEAEQQAKQPDIYLSIMCDGNVDPVGYEKTTNKDVCMYIRVDGTTNRTSHYVKACGGELYDPVNQSDIRYSKKRWKFIKVRYDCFKLYLAYVGGDDNKKNKGKRTFLRNAERLI